MDGSNKHGTFTLENCCPVSHVQPMINFSVIRDCSVTLLVYEEDDGLISHAPLIEVIADNSYHDNNNLTIGPSLGHPGQ